MPLYEYACPACRHTFEELVFDGEVVACPKCRSETVERLLSVPGRPRVSDAKNLPMACNRDLPPCGAANCCRL